MSRLRSTTESPGVYHEEILATAARCGLPEDDLALISACDDEISRWHAGQLRGDGSPYVVHPRRVALLVLACSPEHPRDATLAALLHDVVEDCGVTADHLSQRYGAPVASLVTLLSAPAVPGETREDRLERKRSKWARVAAGEPAAVTVHLADVLDNLMSCRFLDDSYAVARKIPRWLWQAEHHHVPLAERTRSPLAAALVEEIRQQQAAGRATGTWLDD